MVLTLLEFLAEHGYLLINEIPLTLPGKEVDKMAQYMDIHRNVGNIKKEQIDEAHKKDLAVQGKYGVDSLW